MTAFRLTALGATLALGLTAPAQAEPATWQIDPDHAVVAFTIMHAGYAKVLGRFSDIEGSFTYEPASAPPASIPTMKSATNTSAPPIFSTRAPIR